jgi:hypothetical protein
VLGESGAQALSANPLSRYELIRRLGILPSSSSDAIEKAFPQRFSYPLSLFFKLMAATLQACEQQNVSLKIILMPGRSFIEQPGSYSAAFQDYFRLAILNRQNSLKVHVIDLANLLREWYRRNGNSLFHPNEGHLNVLGNKIVAEILQQAVVNEPR